VTSFLALSKKRQLGFLLQLVDSLSGIHPKTSKQLRYAFSARTYLLEQEPCLLVSDKELRIEFVYIDAIYRFRNKAQMVWEVRDLWSSEPEKIASSGFAKLDLIGGPAMTCECSSRIGPPQFCPHICQAVDFLVKRLARASTVEALEWIESIVRRPDSIGDEVLAVIETLQQDEGQPDEDSHEHRLQWRLHPPNYKSGFKQAFAVEPYLQKMRQRGGWSTGRRVRDLINTLPESALKDPHDRTMAMIYDNALGGRYEARHARGLVQALDLLRQCPEVVWELPGLPRANVCPATVEVHLEEQDGHFLPYMTVDGELPGRCEFFLNERGYASGYWADLDRHTIKYFRLTPNQYEMLKVVSGLRERGGSFSRPAAERLAQLLSHQRPEQRLPVRLPESLAGPDTPLEPKLELQLLPLDTVGLEARLRISCAALEESPVPGLGPLRIPVSTPAGAFQLVRDLQVEAELAELCAQTLRLGEYVYDGPYTWRCEGLDKSLELVRRLRELGDRAPTVCWPKSDPLRWIGEITPQCLKISLTSGRDWFGVEGQMEIDGLHLPLAELMASLRSGSRFVPLGGNQFATISDALRARLTVIDDVSGVEGKNLRTSRAATLLVEEALGDDIPAEFDHRWQDALERLHAFEATDRPPPENLNAELRDYQAAGYKWLAKLSQFGLGGVLADDMGLGKTVQTLGVLLDRADDGPALIVAPTSVGINWLRETAKFAPSLEPHLYREHEREQLVQNARPRQLVITSYQLLQRDIERFSSRKWSTLVLDEAQYIKNFQTKTNQAVRQLDVDWCIALSGTPLENHLGELWSLMRVVSPGLLGSWERFRKRFGEPIERDRDPERVQALSQIVRPFILRRTKQEVLKELPPRTEVVRTAEFSPAERKRYDAARLAALADLTKSGQDENDQQRRIRVLSWLTRLRQLACHPKLVDARWDKSSAKLDLLLEIVAELRDNSHRALVFSQFVQHLSLVRAALDELGIQYQYLDGSTSTAKRQEAVDAFQRGEGDLFLISLKAGGTGLNLTAADFVLHLDPWWNPAVEDQATDRAHRIGQSRPVTVYRLVAKDTIEEQILSLHEQKRELISSVLDGADRAAKMSTTELIELIRDSSSLSQV
jgi:superfamily II DNA or RNA helicase